MREVTMKVGDLCGLLGSEPVLVRDESGQTLGTFVPSDLYIRQIYDWAKKEFAKDDLNRTGSIDTGVSIDEMWKRIEQRDRGE